MGKLSILRLEAAPLIANATLRNPLEIEDAVTHLLLVQSVHRESRVGPPASDILRRVTLKNLAEFGLIPNADAIRAAQTAGPLATPSQALGALSSRCMVGKWFFGTSPNFYDE
jgi:recombinational DNA repair protein (RecF pathway)